MVDLIIARTGPGVSVVSSVDPFSVLAIHRIAREQWKETPAAPGVYVLWGVVDEKAAMYIGMSTTDMCARIRQHHVSERKNWFGTLFAIPLTSALCAAVEAELLQRVGEADVIGLVDNRATEARFLNAATSVTSSSISSARTPRLVPTDRARRPSWATPTSSPSASCTRGASGCSRRVTACSDGTVSFTAVLLSILRIAPRAPTGSGRRSRKTAVLKFYGLWDNLLRAPRRGCGARTPEAGPAAERDLGFRQDPD